MMAQEKLFFREELLKYDRLFGLIGYPLSHSFSKRYFQEKFAKKGTTDRQYYELFPLEHIEELPQLQEWYPQLCGLNVTIPYKQDVLSFLTRLDPEAEAVGAVNTIRISGQSWEGFNTDIYGFEQSLRQLLAGRERFPHRALVLGTGGAAKAVIYVLRKLNIKVQLVSRQPGTETLTYAELAQKTLRDYPLIVNTTPLGMSPRIDTCPDLNYRQLTHDHLLYDLVYNPEKTLFLQKGEAAGAAIMNGLPMLIEQAEQAWAIWNTGQ